MMLSGSPDGPHPHIYHHSVRHVPGRPRGLEMREISERITRHVPLRVGCLCAWVTPCRRDCQRCDLVCLLSPVRTDSTANGGLSKPLPIAEKGSLEVWASRTKVADLGLPSPLAQVQRRGIARKVHPSSSPRWQLDRSDELPGVEGSCQSLAGQHTPSLHLGAEGSPRFVFLRPNYRPGGSSAVPESGEMHSAVRRRATRVDRRTGRPC